MPVLPYNTKRGHSACFDEEDYPGSKRFQADRPYALVGSRCGSPFTLATEPTPEPSTLPYLRPVPQMVLTAVNPATGSNYSLNPEQFLGQKVVVLFYPYDFHAPSARMLHQYSTMVQQFQNENCVILACSTDSHYVHHAWLMADRADGGVAGLRFPMLSDFRKVLSRDLGLLDEASGIAQSAAVVIDINQNVRAVVPLSPDMPNTGADQVLATLRRL